MDVQNRHGQVVDPVPFFVVTGFVVLGVFSYGPIYLLELGLPLAWGVGVCGLVTVALTVGAYWRFVWTFNPDSLTEVPAAQRLERIIYGALILAAVLVLLSIPLFI
jgi:hypothetical protein